MEDIDLDKTNLVSKKTPGPTAMDCRSSNETSNNKDSVIKKENPHTITSKALGCIDTAYNDLLKTYTDGSKDQALGKTEYAFIIPNILKPIQVLACQLKQKNIEIIIERIPNNVDILGNEHVDTLARLALKKIK